MINNNNISCARLNAGGAVSGLVAASSALPEAAAGVAADGAAAADEAGGLLALFERLLGTASSAPALTANIAVLNTAPQEDEPASPDGTSTAADLPLALLAWFTPPPAAPSAEVQAVDAGTSVAAPAATPSATMLTPTSTPGSESLSTATPLLSAALDSAAPLPGVAEQKSALPQELLASARGDTPAPDAALSGFERLESWLHRSSAPAETRALTPVPQSVNVAPDHPDWADELGQQVVWSARQGLQSAELKLHPRELGSVSVSLQLDRDSARVSFSAAHPAAVSALEQALPRLRELFAEQGLNLVQAQVADAAAQHGGERRAPLPQSAPAASAQATDESAEDSSGGATLRVVRGSGLLDDYA